MFDAKKIAERIEQIKTNGLYYYAEIAKEVGVGYQTLYKFLRNPEDELTIATKRKLMEYVKKNEGKYGS